MEWWEEMPTLQLDLSGLGINTEWMSVLGAALAAYVWRDVLCCEDTGVT